jgi:hypothetical protein
VLVAPAWEAVVSLSIIFLIIGLIGGSSYFTIAHSTSGFTL